MNAEARMSGELSVRFVVREDYEQWLPLWDGYNAFYGRSGATALSPEITRMRSGRGERRTIARPDALSVPPQHHGHRTCLLLAGFVHQQCRARKRHRQSVDQSGL